ncbi:uridine kinase [Thermoproteota archaeon]
MIGDVLLLKVGHDKAAKRIMDIILKHPKLNENRKFIVAISGESGAGKSEVSHRLAEFASTYNLSAKILHIDNYYNIPAHLRNDWRKKKGQKSIGAHEYNWGMINQNILDFKHGNASILPCIDRLTGQADTLITNFRSINILIIEGLYAIRAKADLKVYIDLTYHETKTAQIKRRKEVLNESRVWVLEGEHKALSSLKQEANYVITKSFNLIPASKWEYSNIGLT